MSTRLGNIGDTEKSGWVATDLQTGETPVYNVHDDCFYYVNIEPGEIHQYNPSNGHIKKWQIGKGMVGGVVVNHDGSLIGVAQDGIFAFRPQDGALVMSHVIEPDKPDNRPNDIGIYELADGTTRIVVGCIPVDRTTLKPDEKPGVIYTMDTETLELKPLRDDIVTSNSLCGYHEDGENIVFYAETDKNNDPKIWKASYNAETGQLEDEQVFLTHGMMQGGRPDGASLVEVDGHKVIAVAALDTNKIIGFDVHTAEAVFTVEAPANLTLTHAAFGWGRNGKMAALITSRWQDTDGHEMPGVAVEVPVKDDITVRPDMATAKGYPDFDAIAAEKKIETISPVTTNKTENTPPPPVRKPGCH